MSTERSDFKDGDRVWVEDEDQWGTITFAGGWAALVLMDDGTTCRASYTHLSRLIPETHTDVPEESASPLDVACEFCGAKPGVSCVNMQNSAIRSPHRARRDSYAGLADCGMDFSQTSGSEQQTSGVVDMVNHPPHYQANPAGIEVIQITEHLNFCLGNAVKYILRADHKGDAEKDLRKAIWYLERELQRRAAPASVEVTPDEEEQAK